MPTAPQMPKVILIAVNDLKCQKLFSDLLKRTQVNNFSPGDYLMCTFHFLNTFFVKKSHNTE